MSEVTATDEKLKPIADATGGGTFWTRSRPAAGDTAAADVTTPRISMLSGAKVLAGSGWLGLKDREAYVTKGVKLTPLFSGAASTGFMVLAALLALVSLAWWREGR